MLFDRKWIVREFSPAFDDPSGLDAKLAELGVGPEETHISFMVLFAMAIGLVRSLDDEMCGLVEQRAPFGTWEMMVRSMSTARTLEGAVFTLIQTSKVFRLPYNIELHHQGDTILFEIAIRGKKNPDTTFLESAYARLLWAALCWFSGRQISMLAILNKHSYYEADNRDAAGAPVRPMVSHEPGFPSLVAADIDGFTIRTSELSAPSAIRREGDPLVENLKWFGTLNYSALTSSSSKSNIEMSTIQKISSKSAIFQKEKNRQINNKFERMIKAKVLISSTKKSISEIAFDLGFSTEQNFRKLFHHYSGQTPTQYREIYESGELIGSDHLLDQILEAIK